MHRWVALVTLMLATGCAVVSAVPTPVGLDHARSVGRSDDRDLSERIVIDADAMQRLGNDPLVVFTGRAVFTWPRGWRLRADRIDVYLDETDARIVKATATGNVRVTTNDCVKGVADRVEYDERRLVLSGNARLWRDRHVRSGDELFLALPRLPAYCAPGDDEPAPRRQYIAPSLSD